MRPRDCVPVRNPSALSKGLCAVSIRRDTHLCAIRGGGAPLWATRAAVYGTNTFPLAARGLSIRGSGAAPPPVHTAHALPVVPVSEAARLGSGAVRAQATVALSATVGLHTASPLRLSNTLPGYTH